METGCTKATTATVAVAAATAALTAAELGCSPEAIAACVAKAVHAADRWAVMPPCTPPVWELDADSVDTWWATDGGPGVELGPTPTSPPAEQGLAVIDLLRALSQALGGVQRLVEADGDLRAHLRDGHGTPHVLRECAAQVRILLSHLMPAEDTCEKVLREGGLVTVDLSSVLADKFETVAGDVVDLGVLGAVAEGLEAAAAFECSTTEPAVPPRWADAADAEARLDAAA